jgi:hypothetical protein
LCKNQAIVLLPSIDLIKENIIKYCGTCFGFNHGGFKAMFIDSRYLQLDDGALNDEDNEDVQVEKLKFIDIGGLTTMNVNVPNYLV